MKDIVIFGSGGFAREIAQLIEDINGNSLEWNVLGYLDDNFVNHGKFINDLKVLGGSEWLSGKHNINLVVGIGSPLTKKKIIDKLTSKSQLIFPNLIHPNVKMSKFNNIGMGNIICEGNILTTNIEIEDFVTLNLNCTVGHDTKISSFSTILPNASISGEVIFEECVDFGTNATIIQGIKVGKGTIVGAGAVVVKDLPANCTAVGMPAKPIKFHEEISHV